MIKFHEKLYNAWFTLTNRTTNRKIFGAALIVGSGTALVKIASVSKELVVAWNFGTKDELDAFFIAYIVPSFIINVIAGSFQAALIPTYIQILEKEGRQAAQKLFSGVINWALLLLIVTTIIFVASAPLYLPLVARGFSPSKLNLTLHLLYAIAPLILFNGISLIWSAILNARERFALASVSPIITPIVTIILLLSNNSWGSFNLVAGLIFGTILEIFILGIGLKHQGILLLPQWSSFTPDLRQVFNQYASAVAGSFLMCSNLVIDQSMAAMLSPGNVAALNYADKVVAFPIVLTTTALSTAVMPFFSKMVAKKDWTGLRHTLKYYLQLIFIVTIPIVLLLIIFSHLIVQLLFQRGSFTYNDTQKVAQIMSCYALQLPFYTGGMILVKLITSMQMNYILAWGSALNLIANVGGNYLFMKLFGINGIALSTSFVITLSFCYLMFFSLKYLNKYTNQQELSN